MVSQRSGFTSVSGAIRCSANENGRMVVSDIFGVWSSMVWALQPPAPPIHAPRFPRPQGSSCTALRRLLISHSLAPLSLSLSNTESGRAVTSRLRRRGWRPPTVDRPNWRSGGALPPLPPTTGSRCVTRGRTARKLTDSASIHRG